MNSQILVLEARAMGATLIVVPYPKGVQNRTHVKLIPQPPRAAGEEDA